MIICRIVSDIVSTMKNPHLDGKEILAIDSVNAVQGIGFW
jgi:hypothetical protein